MFSIFASNYTNRPSIMQNLSLLFLALAAFILLLVLVNRMFNAWLQYKERSWMFTIKADNNKAMSNVRIPAYERLVIMLERIAPSSLVMRQSIASVSAGSLQLELIRSVREEFEHNVSLQIYVSNETWEIVKDAKEEVLEIIKEAYTRVTPVSNGMDLSREIFKLEAAVGNAKIRKAIEAIKSEL
jgi:hypothetical protein